MNTEMKNAVIAATDKAEYDQGAKRLLGQKIILAHILVKTVKEYEGMNPQDVVKYIEGDPLIGVVPIEPGLTNIEHIEPGERVVGFNTESMENNEGLARFDIVFYVRMRDGLSQIIINVECQKDDPSEYNILNRAIFYVCRLVSSQKERDFVHSKYDDIKHVYSIWICMNMDENCMDHIHLTKDSLLGRHQWAGKLDLLNIVMIGLSRTLPTHEDKYELHRLLATLLSMELPPDEKLNIIGKEYDIPLEENIRKELIGMCNLSEGIVENATTKAITGVIMNMYRKGYQIEMIADATGKTIEEVDRIIKKEELVSIF